MTSTETSRNVYLLVPAAKGDLEKARRDYEPGRYATAQVEGREVHCYMPGKPVQRRIEYIPVMGKGTCSLVEAARHQNTYETGDLRVDIANSLVWKGGKLVRIPPAELALLKTLILNGENFVQRRSLLQVLERRLSHVMQDNTLSVHMSRLRRALGTCHGVPYIVTETMKGYRWNLPVQVS